MPTLHQPGGQRHRTKVDGSLRATKPVGAAVSALRESISAVIPGVMPFLLLDPTLTPHFRATIEGLILAGRKIADLPMPSVAMLNALYGSGSRDADFAKAIAQSDGRSAEVIARLRVKELAGCHTLNAFCNEGSHIVRSNLPDGGCVTTQQPIDREPCAEAIEAYLSLGTGAREKSAIIVTILQCSKAKDGMWLEEYCRDLIVVDRCEPGPGASIAFSMAVKSLETQHPDGIGKIMCEIFRTPSGWSRRFSPFIATAAQDRAMLCMRMEGDSYEKIAGAMGIDSRSTVMRRVKDLKLSPDFHIELPDGWRDVWLPFLGLDTVKEGNRDESADNSYPAEEREVSDETPADDEWDDDGLDEARRTSYSPKNRKHRVA